MPFSNRLPPKLKVYAASVSAPHLARFGMFASCKAATSASNLCRLRPPTEGLLSQHQPHWNCQPVRLSNDSVEQNPYDTLPCKSGNKACLASPQAGILALTPRREASGTFRQDSEVGTLFGGEGANILTDHIWRAIEQAKRIADLIDERWA